MTARGRAPRVARDAVGKVLGHIEIGKEREIRKEGSGS
jgi:hypothetical protein